MRSRLELQELLEKVLGSNRVYFQAPPNTGMKYPCIVYRFVTVEKRNADNQPYITTGRWEIHHMYKSIKNSLLNEMLFAAPYVEHDRQIIKDGVYNDYYTIHF